MIRATRRGITNFDVISVNFVHRCELVVISVGVYSSSTTPSTYIWDAKYGSVDPNSETNLQSVKYRATAPGNDTVSVVVRTPGCSDVQQTLPLTVIASSTSTPSPIPTITPTSTSVELTPVHTDSEVGPYITKLDFDFEPSHGNGSLRIFFCSNSRYYRLKSTEISPFPRLLNEETQEMAEPCPKLHPVTRFMVNDVEEVCLGTGNTPEETHLVVRCYRIKRTFRDFEVVRTQPPTTLLPTSATVSTTEGVTANELTPTP